MTDTVFGQTGALRLGLGAGELVGALLALAPERRLQLLDSGGARGDDARFLVAGFDPSVYVEARGDELCVESHGGAPLVRFGSVLDLLDGGLWERPGGACFVTFSYELARQFERLRVRGPAPKERAEPDAVLAFCDVLVVHDYARGETFVAGAGPRRPRLQEVADTLLEAAGAWRRGGFGETEAAGRAPGGGRAEGLAPPDVRPPALPEWASSNFTRAEYEAAVGRVRGHIRAGDVYQANLTQRIACRPARGVTPERVFLRLRREHPAAFAAFLRQGARTVVSASPERFLRVGAGETGGGRVVEAWPIKGTRRRGRDGAEDARLRAELLASEKDRAENVMIVDLLRNDLGRVCRYGSVGVAELCALQEHPTLFHLVSKVRGRLRAGVTAGELVRAAFPCGSITGAPKLRAMEILDEIEGAPRGVSMGSVGYFTPGGAADLSVAIRTSTFDHEGAARFHVGGGVVWDSDPAAEYDETLVKAAALLRALSVSAER